MTDNTALVSVSRLPAARALTGEVLPPDPGSGAKSIIARSREIRKMVQVAIDGVEQMTADLLAAHQKVETLVAERLLLLNALQQIATEVEQPRCRKAVLLHILRETVDRLKKEAD